MDKWDFFSLSDDEKRKFVINALSNIIAFEMCYPEVAKAVILNNNLETIKIVLGAYKDGIISEV